VEIIREKERKKERRDKLRILKILKYKKDRYE